jgi:NADH:ubiquinone oxidoreductase subunit 4 (subunit M)
LTQFSKVSICYIKEFSILFPLLVLVLVVGLNPDFILSFFQKKLGGSQQKKDKINVLA